MDMPNPVNCSARQCDRRIGFRMPAPLYVAIERRARERGLPISTIVRRALQHEVEAQ